MVKPPLLKSGDTIVIVAPARKIKPDDVAQASGIFKHWGLHVELSENLFSPSHSYLAGNDEQRLHDFQTALDDPSVRCIICARGGYGTTRILDRLDFTNLKDNPKWIAGFSDITALHLKLASLGIESIHSTMPVLFQKMDSKDSIESLRRVLFDGSSSIKIKTSSWNRIGSATGQLIGGNLSLIVDSLGTNSEPDTANRILVIEEVEEYRYKIDRMLTQLKRAGKMEKLAGLVVGHMTKILDTEISFGESVEQIISEAIGQYSFPVAMGFPSGHENPNLAWVHGATCTFEVSSHGVEVGPA
jgi:muramoyltetrapeptide carboxypeptidase